MNEHCKKYGVTISFEKIKYKVITEKPAETSHFITVAIIKIETAARQKNLGTLINQL